MESIDNLIVGLRKIHGSEFMKMKSEWIESAQSEYSGMPEDLVYLYQMLGYGNVGESRYRIHALIEPEDIFDAGTAEELEGCLIVGDDYAGNFEAYDAKNGWGFGCIGHDGQFEKYDQECNSFIEFLIEWFVENDSA